MAEMPHHSFPKLLSNHSKNDQDFLTSIQKKRMSIWFNKGLQLSDIAELGKGNMGGYLAIEFIEIGEDFLEARMPVDHRTKQPYGLLHGGASVTLAETLGSVASHLIVDNSQFLAVGLEINANHIRSAREGFVSGRCKPLHIGSSTHVWEIRITDDRNRLVCISRLTVAIIRRKDQ
jgi:1,4-dihydroxy-2-naphthoyl-CoA hydrolase